MEQTLVSCKTFWMSGNRNAAVFPLPVLARASTFLPANANGMVAACTGVGLSQPISAIT
jgi:hypothetical protein